MDTPLRAYREPEGTEEDLTGTDLKDQFYSYLSAWPGDRQVIIVENTTPPEAMQDLPQVTFFSKNPHSGRYGFFPVATQESASSNEPAPEERGGPADD